METLLKASWVRFAFPYRANDSRSSQARIQETL